MRILAASDIHGNLDFYRRVPRVARHLSAGAVVLAGDLLGFAPGIDDMQTAQRANAREIIHHLRPLNVPIYYIMGNDDWVELEPGLGQFVSLQGRRVEVGPYNLVGYQYSLPFMGGVFEKSEEDIAKDLVALAPLLDSSTVLVTHSPAKGILDTGVLDMAAGSSSILDLVNKRDVRLHIHGHIHSCFGRAGRHFNVAASHSMRAMLIDLDELTHQSVDMKVEPGEDTSSHKSS